MHHYWYSIFTRTSNMSDVRILRSSNATIVVNIGHRHIFGLDYVVEIVLSWMRFIIDFHFDLSFRSDISWFRDHKRKIVFMRSAFVVTQCVDVITRPITMWTLVLQRGDQSMLGHVLDVVLGAFTRIRSGTPGTLESSVADRSWNESAALCYRVFIFLSVLFDLFHALCQCA